jgi:hypothetical protein
MRAYLEKNLLQKGLVEWFKVLALSSNPSATKEICLLLNFWIIE